MLADAAREARERDYLSGIAIAWHGEAFARQKRLPKLDKLLAPAGDKKPAAEIDGMDRLRGFLLARAKPKE